MAQAYQAGLRRKVGLFTERDGDEALIQDLLDAMAKNQADFTLTFRRLGDAAAGDERCPRPVHGPRGLRRMGQSLARAHGAGAADRSRTAGGHARRQSAVHPRATTASKP